MPRIFISQSMVDEWLSGGHVDLEGDLLRIDAAGTSVSLFINPAVFFQKVEGAEADPHDVVGAVKSSQELAQMGGEHYDSSVVLGDFAYAVTPGFIAVPVGSDGVETVLDGAAWGRLLAGLGRLAPGYT